MRVSDVMTTDVETVRPDQMARDAARFMLQADTGSIPVTDGDRLVGMITGHQPHHHVCDGVIVVGNYAVKLEGERPAGLMG